jgi:cell division protein ZapA (FtsZ GTPase activity inhibitor)
MPPIQKQVQIANRSYPLTIDSNEEPKVQAAQSLIGEKMFVYEGKYPGRDYQDLLAMTSLQLALEMQFINPGKKSEASISTGIESKKNEETLLKLQELNKKLEKALQD